MGKMRIVFCGSGEFGRPTLRRLMAGAVAGAALAVPDVEIVLVVTQPPRPAGRGGQLRPTGIAQEAEKQGLPVATVEKVNAPECVEMLRRLEADLLLVADFGQFIREAARRTFRLGAINLHGSVLPALRGAAPVNWAIIRGLTRTGVTTFSLVDKMDAGPVHVRKETDILLGETADELRIRLAELGVEVVVETLRLLAAGQTVGEAQDEAQATLAPLLKKEDGLINWSADAASIRNLIHGMWSWPGARTQYVSPEGKPLEVVLARAKAWDAEAGIAPGSPGGIETDLTVAAGSGRLEILEIKPAGGRLMPWKAFVNGHRVRAGARFVTLSIDQPH